MAALIVAGGFVLAVIVLFVLVDPNRRQAAQFIDQADPNTPTGT